LPRRTTGGPPSTTSCTSITKNGCSTLSKSALRTSRKPASFQKLPGTPRFRRSEGLKNPSRLKSGLKSNKKKSSGRLKVKTNELSTSCSTPVFPVSFPPSPGSTNGFWTARCKSLTRTKVNSLQSTSRRWPMRSWKRARRTLLFLKTCLTSPPSSTESIESASRQLTTPFTKHPLAGSTPNASLLTPKEKSWDG